MVEIGPLRGRMIEDKTVHNLSPLREIQLRWVDFRRWR